MSDINSRVQEPVLEGSTLVQRINRFMRTPKYIMLTMLVSALANMFSLELVAYGLYAVLAVYICLLGTDLLPIIPLVISGYVIPSAQNNPGREETSIFFAGHGGNLIIVYAVVIVVSLVYRLIRDRKVFFSRKYAMLSGMLVLTAAYLLSGIGSDAYPAAIWPNVRFALIQGCALLVPYLLIAGGVKWEKARNDYFAWVGFGMGTLLLVEIIWLYATRGVVVDGIIQRKYVYTGWGIHNNLGGLMAMMIPFAFYLATKYNRGWIGTVAGSAFLTGVFMTCSRGSILMGVIIYLICVLFMLHYAKNRRNNFIAFVTIVGMIIVAFMLFHKQLLQLFSDILNRGTDSSGRDTIYYEGLKLFRQSPVFGNSFFSPGYTPYGWSTTELAGLIPSRWHNTVIQLLASCGVVGMLAYLVHRVQTVRFFLKNRTKENNFIGFSMLVLVCCSLVDCHFFNIGPVLFYSMGLAFAENIYKSAR